MRRVLPVGSLAAAFVLVTGSVAGAQGLPGDSVKAAALARLVNAIQFGIPSSPAFELLPGKPSEVVTLLSPSDVGKHVKTWTDGTHLLAGAGFDMRPFADGAGSLTEYHNRPLAQVKWRTVFSAGTAAATDKPKDVLAAFGIRLPLIDRGDPRADLDYQNELSRQYGVAFDSALRKKWPAPPPDLSSNDPRLVEFDSVASEAVKKLRDAHLANSWNAMKLDIGLAASVRTLNGIAARDSVRPGSGGVWVAGGIPIPGMPGQLSASGKWTRSQRDTATQETSRAVYGARVRMLSTHGWSFSAEWSAVNATHADKPSLNENWKHYGVLLEIPSPLGKGIFGIGYGGDTPHGTQTTRQIGVQYALYENRILKK